MPRGPEGHGENSDARGKSPIDNSDDLVGRAVRKLFNSYGWFQGTVRRQVSTDSFEVEFEDGDTQTLARYDLGV